MKNLLSLIPVLAFFIAFKMAGDDPNPIVYGTKWLIGSTVAVLLLMLCIYRKRSSSLEEPSCSSAASP